MGGWSPREGKISRGLKNPLMFQLIRTSHSAGAEHEVELGLENGQ